MLASNQSLDFQSQAIGIKFSETFGDIAAISHTNPPPIDPPIIAYKFSIFSFSNPFKINLAISLKIKFS